MEGESRWTSLWSTLSQDLAKMPERQRILITDKSGLSFGTSNPFRIADEIRRLVGEVEEAQPTQAGGLLITTRSSTQADVLLQLTSFLERSVEADSPVRLNSVEGIAFTASLQEVSDEELLAELQLQGVIGVNRLRPRNNRTSPGIRLRFLGLTCPEEIWTGFQRVKIRPWQPAPLMCRRCACYGHTKKRCRAAEPRCLRCSGAHPADDCVETSAALCPHCGGAHPAWDRRCLRMQEHFKHLQQQHQPTRPAIRMASAATQTTRTWRNAAAQTATYEAPAAPPPAAAPTPGPAPAKPAPQPVAPPPLPPRQKLPPGSRPAAFSDAGQPVAPVRMLHHEVINSDTSSQPGDRPETPLGPTTSTTNPDSEDEDQGLLPREPLPRVAEARQPTEISFRYADGKQPPEQPHTIYRFDRAVQVAHLDLRSFTNAFRAASRGYYFDAPQGGERLYLRVTNPRPRNQTQP